MERRELLVGCADLGHLLVEGGVEESMFSIQTMCVPPTSSGAY